MRILFRKSKKNMEDLMDNKKLNSGITLIVLVITVIILVILASVGISMLRDENGILRNAINAKEKANNASEEELINLAILDANIINKMNKKNLDESLKKNFDRRKYNLKYFELDDIYILEFEDSGKIYKIKNNNLDVCNVPSERIDNYYGINSTLVSTKWERTGDSGFLGISSNIIKRRNIKEINLVRDKQNHTVQEEICWDVTKNKSEKYIAWYEEDDDGYFIIYIAGEDGIIANEDSTCLFSYLGINSSEPIIINGLEILNTKVVTSMKEMFSYTKLKEIDINSFDMSNVTTIDSMFYACSIKKVNMQKCNAPKLLSMKHMFLGCGNLESVDMSSLSAINVTRIDSLFFQCSKLKEWKINKFTPIKN